MESNESENTEKHETGIDEKENLEIISLIAASDGLSDDNVISKWRKTRRNRKTNERFNFR